MFFFGNKTLDQHFGANLKTHVFAEYFGNFLNIYSAFKHTKCRNIQHQLIELEVVQIPNEIKTFKLNNW